MLRSGDVMCVGCVQRLHHLDAEACIRREQNGELGNGGQRWLGDAG
ncbi:hypothetical protein [Cyanobium sp. Tous-M-B4]|nr:hypothetical protein [Cyanobium sp. Tous-M-B4]